MPYLGNSHIAGDQINNFKVLDDISSHTSTFDGSASSVVSTSDNTIRIPEHRFIQGQRVTYNNGGGGNIGNLSSGTAYYVIKDTNNTIKLATSLSDANSSTAINLSVLGSGSSHTLNVAFDGVNTKFKITHNGGTSGRINNATQLSLAINNVIQRPNQNAVTFTEGFAIEDQHKIVFKVAPTSSDIFWGSILANTLPTFDISDNKIDNFTGDGSTTEFNLSNIPASNKSIMVTINGVLQHPSDGSTSRSYTLLANILQFTAAPGNGDEIQVRHIGFAGASTSDVTGFYGRTGNVVLTSNDHITTGNINAGIVTATTFVGNLTGNVSGNLTVGGVLTYEDVTNVDSIGIITARSGFKVLAGGANVVGVITARTNIHLEDYIHHLGDLTTKIGFPSANTISMETAGNQHLRIASDGNIGIGTGINNPTSKLHIVVDGVGQGIHIANKENLYPAASTGFSDIRFSFRDYQSGGSSGAPAIIRGQSHNAGATSRSSKLIFLTSSVDGTNIPTEKVRIEHNGNVGIGTNNPGFKLDVDYSGGEDGIRILNRGTGSGSTSMLRFGNDENINAAFLMLNSSGYSSVGGAYNLVLGHGLNRDIVFSTGGTEKVRIDSSGRVGINEQSPQSLLDIHDSANANDTPEIRIESFRPIIRFADRSGAHVDSEICGDDGIKFRISAESDNNTALTERLRIDSNGRLLVSRGGLTASRNVGTKTGEIQVANSGNSSAITIIGYSNDVGGPHLVFGKSRAGNASGSTILQSGDRLGEIAFCGADGTDIDSFGAAIKSHVDGTPGANDMPGRLELYTTPDGGTAAVERLRITNDGKVGINSTSPQAQLDVCHNDGVYVKSVTNGAGAKVRFSDNGAESFTQIGTIEYKHQNNVIIDGMEEAFRIAGTEGTTGVQIEGLLKVTAQPCAVVYQCTGPAGGAANDSNDNKEPLHFDHVHINQGGMTISQNNARIQVPVTGIYFVSYMVSGTVTNVDVNDGIELLLLVNGNEYPATNSGAEPVFNFGASANAEEFFGNNTLLVSLSKDDYVEVALDNIGSSDANINRGNFSVMLMS